MPKKYNHAELQKKYTALWRQKKVYEPNIKTAKKPFYNLMMFPYPSAEGLHVGNMYAFTGSDVYGRFKRMQGFQTFEPIGLDGFGIHSENYAMKVGTHPIPQAAKSEKRFYKQLEMVGNGFSWENHVETYDPEYYKWTQWLFTQMWKKGLAYRKKQSVNWCSSCKTVLADEQVVSGKCERCSTEVEKRDLEQWFFRITKYTEKLLKNIEKNDWSEKVKIAQRNWIGKSEGATIKFQVSNLKSQVCEIEIFTTRPDTLFGATYLVLAPEADYLNDLKPHIENWYEVATYQKEARNKKDEERLGDTAEKTGVRLQGIIAINPATQKPIPVFVADYVLGGYGTGAIMAVPAHDGRDNQFAKKFNLSIIPVINPVLMRVANPAARADAATSEIKIESELWEGAGELINSGEFSGKNSAEAGKKITEFVGGKMTTQFRLRDWLISRQRYWGPPIPMIYCESCAEAKKGEQKEMPGWYAVPEKNLPVVLPYVKNFRPEGTGASPLASVKSFYEVKCPVCGKKARRETDVSDTFLDSAWYYLRYLDAKNTKKAFDTTRIKKWLPVHMYIGGAEHSVLHLLYIRFVAMALKDMKLVDFEEPIQKFRAHGLVIKDGAKMSKSKGNVVNPDAYVKEFGADAFRMYLMFLAPFEQGGDFRDQGILGTARFLERLWKVQTRVTKKEALDKNLERIMHQTIKKVTEDIEALRYNTAISALMIFLNEIEKYPSLPEKVYEVLLKLLAPFAPFITEELYQSLHGKKSFSSIHASLWPMYDAKKTITDVITLVIQVNGKVRAQISVSKDISQAEAEKMALENQHVINFLQGASPKKIIFVPGRLLNIVI